MRLRVLSWVLIGGVVLTVLVYTGLLIFLTWPVSELSIGKSGVFGDSFGLLTSLFSGLAFAGLIITIYMQRDELALQREELKLTRTELASQKIEMKAQNKTLKIQRFENTFFKMLEFLNNCRDDIVCFRLGEIVKGKDAIRQLYGIFIEGFLCENIPDGMGSHKSVFRLDCINGNSVVKQYNFFYEEYGDGLGQYYRTLYNLLKLVDRADFIDEKLVYTNLVRAQLSRHELSLLFYNSLSDFGREKMAPLVKKYKILKHLEPKNLPVENLAIWREFSA